MIPLRDEAHSDRIPFVTIGLILANIAVFAYQYSLNAVAEGAFILKTGAIPYEITRLLDTPPRNMFPIPGSLLTSLFVHGGFMHLFGNIIFLWIFGDNIEDQLGSIKFLLFYLVMGVCATVTHMFFHSNSMVPLIGASGAIAGVMGAYLMRHPFAKIDTLFYFLFFIKIIKIPSMVFMGIWFAYQLFYASQGAGGGIAWYAHIGGFIMGIICITPFNKGKKRTYV